jgi:hypothetical protein
VSILLTLCIASAALSSRTEHQAQGLMIVQHAPTLLLKYKEQGR